ncbi:mitochondrial ribosomal subunit S27-domain-containing protein [Mycena floridula]|nr:mitochondrial ribosomal subunit S27-domain-containing protein [Mycena floridula]
MATAGRLQALKRLQCSIFMTTYNPNSVRTGAKYLRARLRGPSMVQYYPQSMDIAKLARDPVLGIVNEAEETRLRDIATRKKRGKGAPKKTKKGDDSKREKTKKRTA